MKYIKLISINSFIFFLLIIIFELIFGNWVKKNNFGYTARELRNIEIPMSVKYGGENYNYTFRRNNFGFIGQDFNPEKIKVLFLGGSTGEQMYIPTKFSIVEQLNKKLGLDTQNLKIINASKGGKSTRGYVNDFVNWFPKVEKLKPEIVIFYIGLNDSTLKLPKHFDELDRKAFFERLEDLVKNNSVIYKFKKKIQNKFFNPIRLYYGIEKKNLYKNFKYIDYEKAQNKFKKYEKNNENLQVLKNFEENLNNLKKIIVQAKIKPIFITQIRFDGISDYNLFLVNQYLKKFAKKNKFEIIKLDEIANNINKNDFYDEVHTTIKGSIKISNHIYPNLKEIINNSL